MSDEKILNKYIELIDKGYCCDCNELNCIDNFPHKKIANAISNLQQENQQLKEIEKEHQKINGELREENKKLKAVIDELDEKLDYLDDDIMATCENYDVNGIELKRILNKIKE